MEMEEPSFCRGMFGVLCLNVNFLVWMAILKGLGVMLLTLTEQFQTKIWLIGWTGTIFNAVSCLAAPLSMPMEAMLGTRAVVMTAGFLVGMSMIFASLATGVLQLTLSLALFAAPSLSFVNILCRAMIGRHLPTNYATATGVGNTGTSFGMIFMTPLVQLLLNTYGWRGAMMILGGIGLHLGVCGSLLGPRPSRKQNKYKKLPHSEEELSSEKSNANGCRKPLVDTLRDALFTLGNHFGIALGFKLSFWIAMPVFVCPFTTVVLWSINFISFVESRGFSESNAVAFTIVAGIANLLGKITLTTVVDRGVVSLRVSLITEMLVHVFALAMFPWINSYWFMMANAFMFHLVNGAIISKSDLYTRELLGANELVSALSWYELGAGIMQFILGFSPGWIYDRTGSYQVAFFLLGGFCTLPLVALLIEYGARRWKPVLLSQ